MNKNKKRMDKKTGKVEHFDLWTEAGEEVRDGFSDFWEFHPRPQMKRTHFLIVKEGWRLNGKPIRVPFPPQSLLSGFQEEVGDELEYQVEFTLSDQLKAAFRNGTKSSNRTLLHFGAVDCITEVYLNDRYLGKNEGGYLPFSFDISEEVHLYEKNTLKLLVTDTLDRLYPYGKQAKKRGGMWYTPVSGIWQNVWLEVVPENYIRSIKITPDLRGIDLELEYLMQEYTVRSEKKDAVLKYEIDLGDGRTYCQSVANAFAGNQKGNCVQKWKLRIDLEGSKASDGTKIVPNLWTVDNPHLYSMKLMLGDDLTETYFALRTIGIEEVKGISRVCLNHKPIFLHGVLDQGYYSDGLYLPAREEEYEKDILRMKELGYNMLRKHIKVEPEYFYYACDRLGMLVMQDMVNNGPYSFLFDTALPTIGFKKRSDTRAFGLSRKEKLRRQFFEDHMRATIEQLYNHPSIVAYTIFNEGWGQFHSDEMYELVKKMDDTRLIDSTSGWFAQAKNDFDSEHIYFKEIQLTVKDRPLFVSECGGYSLQIPEHYYNKNKQYGYGACESKEVLTERIEKMYRIMILSSAADGLCGCVYTQLSDVEDEINGLYTYDRKVCKVLPERMKVLAKELQDAVQ